jgi:TetR/AcrR family transcriptional repressor of nem operon
MARPRSFDVDVVLDKAVEAFRARGYEATSVGDLERTTGLGRASLYAAFKGKHALYLAALRRYDATRAARMLSLIEAEPTGRAALVKMFDLILKQCAEDPSGCLMANAAMERGATDEGAARCIADNRRRIEGALQAAVLRGRADGSLKSRGDAAATARLLFTVVLGLRNLAKSGSAPAHLAEVVEQALKAA